MPNWCYNIVELEHSDPAMITRAHEAFKRGEFLNEFVPIPQDLRDTVAGSLGSGEEQRLLEERTARNQEKYGYGNWYDFCVSEWGTKWDVGGDSDVDDGSPDPTHLTLSFDSAWAPPIDAYRKIVERHGFNIKAYYYEPGMSFCGTWDNDCDDDYYELSGMNADQVEETIPAELNEMFDISDSMREWAEDSQ